MQSARKRQFYGTSCIHIMMFPCFRQCTIKQARRSLFCNEEMFFIDNKTNHKVFTCINSNWCDHSPLQTACLKGLHAICETFILVLVQYGRHSTDDQNCKICHYINYYCKQESVGV